jgi:hypothetical protein
LAAEGFQVEIEPHWTRYFDGKIGGIQLQAQIRLGHLPDAVLR